MSPQSPKKKARVFLPPSNLKDQLSRAGGKSRDEAVNAAIAGVEMLREKSMGAIELAIEAVEAVAEEGTNGALSEANLKDVLRKAPHVILLGEIRDREAMETCMEAAQTGHLVLSTLHTTGAVKTLGRILELYPKENHSAVLSRLSEILIFVHSQGLLNGIERRVLTYEFLQNNDDAVSSAIANYGGGARSLEDVIRRAGNIEWDANLRRLFRQGLIDEQALVSARMNRNDSDIL